MLLLPARVPDAVPTRRFVGARRIAKTDGAVLVTEPPLGNGVDYLWRADLFDLVHALPPQSVDMILADLPYGTTACSWDEVIPFEPMWAAFKRVIRPRGAIVLTASQPFTSRLVCSNLGMFKYCWMWKKTKPSDHINAKNKPMRAHEDIAVFSLATTANDSPNRMYYHPQGIKPFGEVKYRPNGTINTQVIGKRPSHVNRYVQEMTGYPDSVLEFSNGNNFNVHPTQKPVALFEYLIRTYTQPGDVVLDPVVGSGTTALAARNTGRRYICGDASAEYVAIARDRLRAPFEARTVVRETRLDDLPLFAAGK